MKNFLLKKLLGFAGRKMDGKKTYAGAIGKILTGVATCCSGLLGLLGNIFPDQGLPYVEPEYAYTLLATGAYAVFSGLQGVGIGHKLEKAKENVNEFSR